MLEGEESTFGGILFLNFQEDVDLQEWLANQNSTLQVYFLRNRNPTCWIGTIYTNIFTYMSLHSQCFVAIGVLCWIFFVFPGRQPNNLTLLFSGNLPLAVGPVRNANSFM